ncbi:MAG: DNA mismatch repair protein MutS [Clostridia bacterium]|nr:DNA mismatch repair protein MutS [Clostridia bacterium]
MAELSPMMKQYFNIKEKYKDSILFFRLGDFYEMFYDDAKLVAKELELTLTGRDCGQEERAPMCGVPYHSCEAYIARLVEKGYKVAICDQTSEPSSKGLVQRDITRVITPGTVIENTMLDEGKNNYICSIFSLDGSTGFCVCDISTGEISATDISGEDIDQKLISELTKFRPKEILITGAEKDFENVVAFSKEKLHSFVEFLKMDLKPKEECEKVILEQFKCQYIEKLGITSASLVHSIAILLGYLKETQKSAIENINSIQIYSIDEFMKLDLNTCRNLELVETMRSREKVGSLLWVLDSTKTAMGKRLLRTYVERPLLNLTQIIKRQDAVEEFVEDIKLMDEVGEELSGVYDLERLITKVVYSSANARDLRAICAAAEKLPGLKVKLKNVKAELLSEIENKIDALEDIKELIDEAIVDVDIPISIKEGGIIRKGYSKEIDDLRDSLINGKDIIAKIEAREKQATGISKLKVGYNKVFGYYIEVSNSFKNKVPEHYIRKQTLSNCERYIIADLKELESKILGAKDRSMQLEYETFVYIRKQIADNLKRVQTTANNIAKLDVIYSLAKVAYKNNYTKPNVANTGEIIIKEGRHPVVEKLSKDTLFVPNDVTLDRNANRVAVITGPNMAGKSTYMRQVALISIMAQIGSFVPAKEARLGIVDSVFTRVGASDDLSSGQSTFMVEMVEVANIIKNATQNSLVILDEIGRGTSTFDGMSIAKAVLEYVQDKEKLGCKTLFATHYHELIALEDSLEGVKNYNIAAKKRGDDLIFLRRIVRGGADDSYGIEVAKLAGVPNQIIERAREVLRELESGKQVIYRNLPEQMTLKTDDKLDPKITKIAEEIKKIDPTTLTPIESMNILFKFVNDLKD